MKLNKVPFMTPSLQGLCRKLKKAGYSAYFVGGCVRDSFKGRPVNDVDLSTDATPDQVREVFSGDDLYSLYPTGVEHGTWTVGVNGENYEVTSYRKDVETDGRRAVVEFSTDLKDDAYRRDFTMNALYMDHHGNVVDPTGEGMSDLLANRLRFVGNADERCREDYLRILRLFRFHAQLGGFYMDHEALEAVARNAGGLRAVSGERVWAELKKMLGAPDPSMAVWYMEKTGVLKEVFRGYKTGNTDMVHEVVAAELNGGYAPRWQRRYAALVGLHSGVPFPAAKAEKRHQERVKQMFQRGHHVLANAYMSKDWYVAEDAYVLNRAAVNPRNCHDMAHTLQYGLDAKLPVTSGDLMDRGVPAGPVLGTKLKRADELFVSSHLSATKATLLRQIL